MLLFPFLIPNAFLIALLLSWPDSVPYAMAMRLKPSLPEMGEWIGNGKRMGSSNSTVLCMYRIAMAECRWHRCFSLLLTHGLLEQSCMKSMQSPMMYATQPLREPALQLFLIRGQIGQWVALGNTLRKYCIITP